MPATHEVSAKLPAVSGSAGRLIVERPPAEDNGAEWPGRIFENPELPYADAMLAFVASAQERARQPAGLADAAANGSLATEKRTLGRTEAQLRDARRQVREQRQLEDAAWQTARGVHRAAAQADQGRPKAERRPAKATRTAQWCTRRDQRRATLAARHQDDAAWRSGGQPKPARTAQWCAAARPTPRHPGSPPPRRCRLAASTAGAAPTLVGVAGHQRLDRHLQEFQLGNRAKSVRMTALYAADKTGRLYEPDALLSTDYARSWLLR